jgi:hypothetical protein
MLPALPEKLRADLENQLSSGRQLVSRLERLSADSHWARRASGYRASLLKAIERLERWPSQPDVNSILAEEITLLSQLIERGYQILDRAARELVKGRRNRAA